VLNLFIVWGLTGLWHGAAWTFVFWGLFFFVLIAFEKVTGFDKWIERIPVMSNIYLLALVIIGWVPFRADGASHSIEYLLSMFGANANPLIGVDTFRIGLEYYITWFIGLAACIPVAKMLMKNRYANTVPAVVLRWLFAGFVLMLSFAIMGGSDATPFIYFAF